MADVNALLRQLLEENRRRIEAAQPEHVGGGPNFLQGGGPALTPEMQQPQGMAGMFGPPAPPTQTTTQVARQMPALQRMMLGVRAPNTRLSHNKGQARGQLFIRGLAQGLNSGALNSGYGAKPGQQDDPLEMEKKRLTNEKLKYEVEHQGDPKAGPSEWDVDKWMADQEYRQGEAKARGERAKIDDDRAQVGQDNLEAYRALLESGRVENRGMARERLNLARQRFGLAQKKAAAGVAASDKWPDAVKIPYQTRVKELAVMYDGAKDDADEMRAYSEAVDALTLEATRQAQGMAGVGTVRDPNKAALPGPLAPAAAPKAQGGGFDLFKFIQGSGAPQPEQKKADPDGIR